ncbi:MAG: dihydroorotate dehydrogenase electron transfer subunit [Vicinamibacterales bacterium]
MTVDVDAEVLFNRRLSEAYNVLGLAAPAIADAASPGQFVMIRPTTSLDPLLRRPFSIFEILRAQDGTATGFSILNKRVGVGTSLLYAVEAGRRVACLGPLGTPFVPVAPPAEAWMVAGGVGLAPFATLATALRDRGTAARLFYGARSAADLFCADVFERAGIPITFATEDGSRGDRGFVTLPLARALSATSASTAVHVYACGPTPMMRAVADTCAAAGRAVDVSLEQVMGCGLGGCYSCVVQVREPGHPAHFVRSCLAGPVFPASHLVWETLAH